MRVSAPKVSRTMSMIATRIAASPVFSATVFSMMTCMARAYRFNTRSATRRS
jgi:hypothetical protein